MSTAARPVWRLKRLRQASAECMACDFVDNWLLLELQALEGVLREAGFVFVPTAPDVFAEPLRGDRAHRGVASLFIDPASNGQVVARAICWLSIASDTAGQGEAGISICLQSPASLERQELAWQPIFKAPVKLSVVNHPDDFRKHYVDHVKAAWGEMSDGKRRDIAEVRACIALSQAMAVLAT